VTAAIPARAEPTGPYEGAGVLSSADDFHQAWSAEDPDPLALMSTGLGLGLDALRFVADPFGEGVQAGVGYLLEHVPFLHDFLDALAGDPGQIVARATDWRTGAATLAGEARALAGAIPGAHLWAGPAADAARAAAEREAAALTELAGGCAEIAELLVRTGAMIGVERSLVRDALAEFVYWLLRWLAAALVATLLTAGAAMAAMVPGTIIEATSLASRLLDRMSTLLDLTEEAARRTRQVAQRLEQLTDGWGAPEARRFVEPFADHVNRGHSLALDTAVESGKAGAAIAADQRDG
jgi:hypothetical protein